MATVLPLTPSIPLYTFRSVLGGVTYGFRMRWNSVEELWYMDVFEEDGTVIIRSIAIVIGAYLGRSSTHALFMGGLFVARDTTRQWREAGFDDLGTRVEVWFFTNDEARQESLAAVTDGSR